MTLLKKKWDRNYWHFFIFNIVFKRYDFFFFFFFLTECSEHKIIEHYKQMKDKSYSLYNNAKNIYLIEFSICSWTVKR